jgi:hypothetical protein
MKIPQGKLKTEMLYIKILKKNKYKKNVLKLRLIIEKEIVRLLFKISITHVKKDMKKRF